jgi:hypothetical protein
LEISNGVANDLGTQVSMLVSRPTTLVTLTSISKPTNFALLATKSFHGTNVAGKATCRFLGTVRSNPKSLRVPPVLKLASVAVALLRWC